MLAFNATFHVDYLPGYNTESKGHVLGFNATCEFGYVLGFNTTSQADYDLGCNAAYPVGYICVLIPLFKLILSWV